MEDADRTIKRTYVAADGLPAPHYAQLSRYLPWLPHPFAHHVFLFCASLQTRLHGMRIGD